jgi:hypothetical protein
MGNRSEQRKAIEVSVRIFGTDYGGRIFSENVTTVDVSHNGAKVSGVKTQLKLDEIIGLTYGNNKVHFRVKWVGEPGSPSDGQIGLLNLTPEKPLWDFALPSGATDTFSFVTKNRRSYTRVILGGCGLGFDGDLHLRTRFEAYLVAVFVRQSVVNSYFPIQMIRSFHGDLCFLRFTRKWGLDDFFNRSRQNGTRLFAHGLL